MAHATYPAVFRDENNGEFVCQMKDKKTGKIWGTGYGITRLEAIVSARKNQPSDSKIKHLINWAVAHPFIGGATVGLYVAYRVGRNSPERLKLGDYLALAVVGGVAVWAASKIVKLIRHTFNI